MEELCAGHGGVQQIEIEIAGAETSEARLASSRDAVPGHFIGLYLGDQEDVVALIVDHVTEELLGAAVPVVSRRIDQVHAERNACAERFFLDFHGMSFLAEMPAALTERGDGGAVWKFYGTRCRLRCRACVRLLCICRHSEHGAQSWNRHAERRTTCAELTPIEQLFVCRHAPASSDLNRCHVDVP